MEILDSLGINWKILLGQIFNFLVILYLLKRFAFKPFLKILNERNDKIKQGIELTEGVQNKMSEIEISKEKILEGAQEKASLFLDKSQQKGQEMKQKLIDEGEKEKEKILKEAVSEGKREAEEIKAKTEKEMNALALKVAEEFLKEKIDSLKDKKIIESHLDKLHEKDGR